MMHSTLLFTEPRWLGLQSPSVKHLPAHWRAWLSDNGSLTQRLIALSQGHFRVAVLREDWRSPTANERLTLGSSTRQLAWVREVMLLCHEQPMVYARSIIPATTLSGKNRYLKHLGNKPLGAALFANPTLERAPLQIARIDTLRNQRTITRTHPAWARRSVFYVNHLPLLVCEIFLPTLLAQHYAD